MPAAITAIGAVCGHGLGIERLADALAAGRTAVAPLTRFSAHSLCSELAAEAPENVELQRAAAQSFGPETSSGSRAGRLLLAAAAEALGDGPAISSDRRGVLVGTTKGALEPVLEAWEQRRTPSEEPLGALAALLARVSGARGPVQAVGAACASSTVALGRALEWIDRGVCDEVVVAGAEALHPFVYFGFHALKALSPRPAAPFDAERAGLSLGEGAAVLVLENTARARAAGRPVLGTVEGFGWAADGKDQTAPDPFGAGLLAACRRALGSAGVRASEIVAYHAHGTATRHNDQMEAAAYAALFAGRPVPLAAVKGSIGHTLGAAGALDAVACLLSLRRRALLPVTNLQTVDAALPVDAVRGQPRPIDPGPALLATAGFGGINAALVLRAEGS